MPKNELKFGREIQQVIYSDFSGGLRLGVEAHRIRDNEVWGSVNAILHSSGAYLRPAATGLTGYTSTASCQGEAFFNTTDGTEYHIVVENGNVYQITSDTTGARGTSLFDTGNTTQRAYFAAAGGKLFIANGGTFCKVEKVGANLVCYRVGIAKPTTGAVAAAAGGSLPDGVYTVSWSYARRISGIDVLYSQPYSLGTVTLGTGNNTIALTSLGNSSDPQVGNKVIWIREPAGTVDYKYASTGDNATTSVNISDTSGKSASITSRNYADDNELPVNFDYVIFHSNRIVGLLDLKYYYSLKSSENVYDYERYPAANYINYPAVIIGAVSFVGNVYVNTTLGIICQPYGEASYEYFFSAKGEYWKYIDTVAEYGGKLWGLTNYGMKIFDGERFFKNDLSDPVRKEINNIYASTSGLSACAIIYSRNISLGFSSNTISRVIYSLSYNDSKYGMTCNNRRLELNLNAVQLLANDECIAPWEFHYPGYDFVALKSTGVPYFMQKKSSKSVIYYENYSSAIDTNVYNEECLFVTSKNITVTVDLKMIYCGGENRIRFIGGHLRYGTLQSFTIYACKFDDGTSDFKTILSSGGDLSFYDEAEWNVSQWSYEAIGVKAFKWNSNVIGRNLYLKLYYNGGDISWYATDAVINYKIAKNRFTYAK